MLASIDKVDDYTVRFVLNVPQAPFISDMAMDFTSIMSKEYADALLKAGKQEQIDQIPIGTGPYELLQYTARQHHPLSRVQGFLGREAEDRHAGLLHQQGSGGAVGQAARQ